MNTLLRSILFTIMIALYSSATYSHELTLEIQDFLKTIFTDNAEYVNSVSVKDFELFKEKQQPRATVVSCSDSRVQSDAFHKSPVNDLFFIRNIGNQIATTEGSVEYGIYHLHTPILLIIGHSQCGAIQAAMGDYSQELEPIRRELDNLHLPKGGNVNQGVVDNINQQVAFALTKFKDKIDKKELIVLGTLYDFRDDYRQGHGRLVLINFNGEKDPAKIKQIPFLKNVDVKMLLK